MSHSWTSKSAFTKVNSAPLSMLNPPTFHNISTTTVATYINQTLKPLFPSHSGAAHLQPSQWPLHLHLQPYQRLVLLWVSIPLIQKHLSAALHHPNFIPCLSHHPNHFSLTTSYYLGLHHLKWIHREGFHILSSDPPTQDILTKPPSVTFRKPPNLRQLNSGLYTNTAEWATRAGR